MQYQEELEIMKVLIDTWWNVNTHQKKVLVT